MLIRSQNKELIVILENITNIYINKYYKIGEKYYKSSNPNTFLICYNENKKIGEYSTEEKAIKVLNIIQNDYQYCEECKYLGMGAKQLEFVFQMPLDDEVIL